ncbi:MAG TPA: hypothetical protein PKH77_25895 [Anaerolineae bacterium]|nr:hypothetical protein [Anaerolineae bacterium]
MTTKSKRWRHALGLYGFFGGVLLGMFFAALLAWANFEASLFDASTDSSALNLENLKCPVLLNRQETGVVFATFTNSADWKLTRTVDAHITHGSVLLTREERSRFELAPGEKHTLQWPISPEEAAWGRFIFVRLHVQRSAPLPPRTGSCGVLVVNLPYGSGAQIAAVTIGVSLLLMGGGAILWVRGLAAQNKNMRALDYLILALAPATLLSLLCGIMGFWLGSGVLLLVTILLTISAVASALS